MTLRTAPARPAQPRVQPLAPKDLSAEQREFIAPFTDPQGRIANVFATLLRHLPLLRAWRPFGLYAMRGSRLDPVQREVAILRTARRTDCAYEWAHHREIGERLGMPPALFAAIAEEAPFADADQALIARAADELVRDHCLSDTTWQDAMATLGLEMTLDLIYTVGAYTTMAMALNSCGVALETE
ncbi:MAG: carboxymuconolactone decarboxylase family protein [Pseudomonadota bacterium]